MAKNIFTVISKAASEKTWISGYGTMSYSEAEGTVANLNKNGFNAEIVTITWLSSSRGGARPIPQGLKQKEGVEIMPTNKQKVAATMSQDALETKFWNWAIDNFKVGDYKGINPTMVSVERKCSPNSLFEKEFGKSAIESTRRLDDLKMLNVQPYNTAKKGKFRPNGKPFTGVIIYKASEGPAKTTSSDSAIEANQEEWRKFIGK